MLSMKKRLQLKEQFFHAVEDCNIQMMKRILDQGLSKNELDFDKHMYLHYAVEIDNKAMVRLLIWRGVDLNQQDHYDGSTALHLACHKSVKVFNLLLHFGANVNLQNKQGLTPLHVVCSIGKKACKRVVPLLMKGANVELRCKNGKTPLDLAVEHNVGLIKVFLKKRPTLINLTNKLGYTPLHIASLYTRKAKIILFLLEMGADVNARTKCGDTPLHLATWRGRVEIIRALLNHGADINAKCKLGQTPLHDASFQSWPSRVVDLLIEKGAKVNTKDYFGNTPLHQAVGNNAEVVQILIDKGADVSCKSRYNLTPYEESLYYEHFNLHEGSLPIEILLIRQSRYTLVNHIIKLKVAQMHVDVDISKEPIREEYEETKLKSLLELERIKLCKFNGMRLYRLISNKSKHCLSTEDAEKYEQFVSSENFLKQFPVYGHIMRNTFKSLLLMNHTVESFYSESRERICKGLPICVTEIIVAYLSTEDLENFIKSE